MKTVLLSGKFITDLLLIRLAKMGIVSYSLRYYRVTLIVMTKSQIFRVQTSNGPIASQTNNPPPSFFQVASLSAKNVRF